MLIVRHAYGRHLIDISLFVKIVVVVLKRTDVVSRETTSRRQEGERVVLAYLLLVYLVTALVPSLTACLASSPGRRRRTAVWISRDVIVDRLL